LTAYEKNKGLNKWILVIPKILSKNELRWWDGFQNKHKDKEIDFDFWNEDDLLELLHEYKLYDEYFQFKNPFKKSRKKFVEDYRQIIAKFEDGVDIFHINDIDNMYVVSEKWKASPYLKFRNSAIAYMLDHFLMNLSVVNGIISCAEPPIQEQFRFLMKYYFIPEYYRLCRERDNEQDEGAIEFYTNNNAETLKFNSSQ